MASNYLILYAIKEYLMSFTIDIVKGAAFGGDFNAKSTAECIAMLDLWKNEIKPEMFNPLIPITGGFSFIPIDGGSLYAAKAIVVADEWIKLCLKSGVSVKDAILSLAANYDKNPGMVALALEVAMIATKEKRGKSLIGIDEYYEIVAKLYLSDMAGIYSEMSKTWGVELKPEYEIHPLQIEGRKAWHDKNGHDVLISPASLTPYKSDSGHILEYVEAVEDGGKCLLCFLDLNTNNKIYVEDLCA